MKFIVNGDDRVKVSLEELSNRVRVKVNGVTVITFQGDAERCTVYKKTLCRRGIDLHIHHGDD